MGAPDGAGGAPARDAEHGQHASTAAPRSAGAPGRSADRADRELFHGLRAAVDGVLVGAGHGPRRALRARSSATPRVRAERLRARAARGAARVHRLGAPGAAAGHRRCCRAGRRVVVLTASHGEPAGDRRRRSSTSAPQRDGRLDLPAAMAELRRALRRAAGCSARAARTWRGSCWPPGSSTSCSCRCRRMLAGGEPDGRRGAADPRRASSWSRRCELELLGVAARAARGCSCATACAAPEERVSRETTSSSSLAS